MNTEQQTNTIRGTILPLEQMAHKLEQMTRGLIEVAPYLDYNRFGEILFDIDSMASEIAATAAREHVEWFRNRTSSDILAQYKNS